MNQNVWCNAKISKQLKKFLCWMWNEICVRAVYSGDDNEARFAK